MTTFIRIIISAAQHQKPLRQVHARRVQREVRGRTLDEVRWGCCGACEGEGEEAGCCCWRRGGWGGGGFGWVVLAVHGDADADPCGDADDEDDDEDGEEDEEEAAFEAEDASFFGGFGWEGGFWRGDEGAVVVEVGAVLLRVVGV